MECGRQLRLLKGRYVLLIRWQNGAWWMWMCRAIGVGTRLPVRVERENKVQGGLAYLPKRPLAGNFSPP